MKRGNPALKGLLTAPMRRAVWPDLPDSRRTTLKDAGARANPPGNGGKSVNAPEELSYGASS